MHRKTLSAAASVLAVCLFAGSATSAVKSVETVSGEKSAPRSATCYGLFVGVNKYSFSMGASTLYGCVNDAHNMKDAWLNRCDASNEYILTDASATFSSIRSRFQSIAAAAAAGDTVLYYHSSHGGLYDESTKGTFICAYDETYWDTEFAEDLSAFNSGVKIIVVLDTCHSGGMFKDANAQTFAQRVQAMVDERLSKEGRKAGASIGWITAADWNESSYDNGWYDSTYGHAGQGGTFTATLLDGWTKNYADSNSDGNIDFKELYDYSSRNCTASSVQCLNTSVLQSVLAKGGGSSSEGTYITVDGNTENIRWTYNSGAAQSDAFILGCNGTWSISVNGSWIQNVQPSSGTGDATVTFNLAANTQAGPRTGSIVITTGAASYIITIVQPSMTPVNIVFDGNGGKPAKQTLRQVPGALWNTIYLEQPSRSGYIFNGWWTAKTGGSEVSIDGYSQITADTTLYAHWLKQYRVTVNGGTIYLISYNGSDLEFDPVGNSYTFYNGDLFAIYPDGKASMVFSHWSASTDKFDLGSLYDPRDEFNIVEMPESNISFNANYLSGPGYVTVNPRWANPTDNDVDENDLDEALEACQWSSDGKIWTFMRPGTVYPVKTGSVTISYRSLDPRWLAPASQKITAVKDKFNDLYPVFTRVPVIEAEVASEDGDATGSVTLSPANGQVLPGKQVTVAAKPGKNSVFAYWETDEGYLFPSTLKLAPGADTSIKAVFKNKANVVAPTISAGDVVWSDNSMVGVAFEMAIGIPLESRPAKFSATGLPAGLKMDPQSGIISGIPTKAGIYRASVTAASTANSAAKTTRIVEIDVSPLPDWAKGTFSGMTYWEYFDEDDGEWYIESGTYGSGTFTVTEAGKISGKIAQYGTNSTFTAASYDAYSYTEGDEQDWQLVIKGEMKTGKNVREIWLFVQKEIPPDAAMANAYVYGFEDGEGYNFMFWRNMWLDKTATYAATRAISSVQGMYTMALSAGDDYGHGWLSSTIPSSGTVKTTGKLADGTALSITSPLLYDEMFGGYFTFLYNAPSAYKGGSVFFVPIFDPEGDVYDLGLSQWTSSNPAATDNYGDGFYRAPGFVGYWYDPKVSMRDLGMWALQFTADQPWLFVSPIKYTYYNDYGWKVTDTLAMWLDPYDTSDQTGNIVYVNYSGNGFITEPVTKPIQYGGFWYYLGENDAALSMSFNPATGVFKGSYTFWYDYWKNYDETTDTESSPAHTSKKVAFEGILVWNYDLGGFFTWDDTAFYDDPKTGKEKSYKYKQSFRVGLENL